MSRSIAQQRVYAPQLVAPGFATFCLRYRYGKTLYARETLYEIGEEDLR